MLQNDTTINFYPIPRSFCLTPYYINYTNTNNITLSTDRIVNLNMKFEYEFLYDNNTYKNDCIITSNTTLHCVIHPVVNKTVNDNRIFFNFYYYDLNPPYERKLLQQLHFYYTFDEEKLKNIDSCNDFGNKCDNCGYCNGNNQCYSFSNSCDNILYNKPCDDLCGEDEIKIDKECCTISSLDCYGECNGKAEIVNITSSSSSSVANKKYELNCCLFDCNNTCNGLAYMECDECIGGLTGKNSTMDCNGTCNGYGIENECGYCVNISGIPLDYGIDCEGGCDKDLSINNCGVCDYFNYTYCEIGFEENEHHHNVYIDKDTRRVEYYFDVINRSNKSVVPYISDALSSYNQNMKLLYKHDRYWIPVGSSYDIYQPYGIINFRLDVEMGNGFTQVINNMNNAEAYNLTFKSDMYKVYESQIHLFHYINNSTCSEITNYVLCNNIPGCYCCYYSDGINSQIAEKNVKYIFNCVNYNGNSNPCFVSGDSSSYIDIFGVYLIFVILFNIFIF